VRESAWKYSRFARKDLQKHLNMNNVKKYFTAYLINSKRRIIIKINLKGQTAKKEKARL